MGIVEVPENEVVSAHDELDLTSAGFEVPQTNWQISEARVESPKPGQQRAVVTFRTEHDGLTYEVTDRYWIQYTGSGDPAKDKKVTQIGQGQLKKLFVNATGSPKASVAALEGKWVSARGEEDENGFRRLRSMRPAEDSVEAGDTGEL